ncbi:unnamed protein product [Pleuronectes platessa]|uniref:Uncharacterized protein n=1 Tax=Pleuronectes platessa TaxID=8262 RepID=A0A9N7UZL6_PLEPL|nr:unnamed protein product [Pleuronectes platessa]
MDSLQRFTIVPHEHANGNEPIPLPHGEQPSRKLAFNLTSIPAALQASSLLPLDPPSHGSVAVSYPNKLLMRPNHHFHAETHVQTSLNVPVGLGPLESRTPTQIRRRRDTDIGVDIVTQRGGPLPLVLIPLSTVFPAVCSPLVC